MSLVRRFFRQPQGTWSRRALFQVHLWCGILIGFYIVMISLTGSLLVYRNELRAAFNPEPRSVVAEGERIAPEALVLIAQRSFPGKKVVLDYVPEEPTHAVTFVVGPTGSGQQILFDPYTGENLGNALPLGWRLTSWTLDLHDNLLSGETGRAVNGVFAITLTVLGLTGFMLWWPGVLKWRRSLFVDWRSSWKRFNWSLHSSLGLWLGAFVVLWGVTGTYLSFPQPFTDLVDYLEPLDMESFEERTGDTVLYWLGYLHFGRFGGEPTKFLWALFGLVPPTLFVTGAVMWWHRVIKPRLRRR